jgi:hypothetical protein
MKLTATKGAIFHKVLQYTYIKWKKDIEVILRGFGFIVWAIIKREFILQQYMSTLFNHVPKLLHQKHFTVSGSMQTVPAVTVYAALQEVHKWNWTGVNCVCVCLCVLGGGKPFVVWCI